MKSVPWGLTFDPGLNASLSFLFHFTVLVTLDAFWFVDFSFLSLFFQEAVKAAGMCVSVCVSKVQYSSFCTSPVESVSFSAVVLRYITRWYKYLHTSGYNIIYPISENMACWLVYCLI